MKTLILPILFYALSIVPLAAEEPFQSEVYVQGQNGFHTYRIPALIVTPHGDILAFAEARKNNQDDHGHLETVVRRSEDGGKTWGPVEVVASDGPHAVQNPTPVIDRKSGTIWLCLIRTSTDQFRDQEDLANATERARSFWILRSKDDGRTWSEPRDISDQVYQPGWTELVPGPGQGIQLSKGRLLIPCYCQVLGETSTRSVSVYSDDAGETWTSGRTVGPQTNECQAVELADGKVLMNMRSYRGKGVRAIATSNDCGVTWSEIEDDSILVEPVCQASLITFEPLTRDGKHPLIFSNPARSTHDDRQQLTLRVSYDEGKTWPHSKCLNEGFSAYSSLAVLPDGEIGCLFEQGIDQEYDRIAFARFSLEWLTDDKAGK